MHERDERRNALILAQECQYEESEEAEALWAAQTCVRLFHLAVLQPIVSTEQGGAHASPISHHTVHLHRRQVQYVIGPDSSFLTPES